MLVGSQSDDVGVKAKRTATVLNTSQAHGSILGEWLRAALPLKSESIENRLRAVQKPLWI
ncbi:MAG TPA: hypothetical protein VG146_12030 [Verrucomicrobiae bacterium]|nr:hypothetical protein [Verrucomicrobiae bacterium]